MYAEGEPANKRSITHYQYIHWPDFGSPNAKTLVELVRRVGAIKPDKPMVLHCSAGVGRTGVFATVHSSLECHLDARHVDLQRTVAGLRRQREGMVQTQDQYRFCYEAIAEALLPAEQDEELTQQVDARPMSCPPPPYREKEESRESSPQSRDQEPSPPTPPTSPPPPLSEPSTPVKAAVSETPPTTTPLKQSPTDSLEKKRLSEVSVVTTPSRPVSGAEEGEAVRRKVLDREDKRQVTKQEVTVEMEPIPKSVRPEAKKVERVVVKKEQAKAKKAETTSGKSGGGQSSHIVPAVIVTAPSVEQLNEWSPPLVPTSPPPSSTSISETTSPAPPTSHQDSPSTSKDPPPLPTSSPPSVDPPPLPTSPPPSEDPVEQEEVGFSIGENQVIVEKPYSKAPVSKSGPSNMPKWKHGKTTPTSSSSTSQQQLPQWKLEMQRRKEEAGKKEVAAQHGTPGRPEQRTTVNPVNPGKVHVPDIKRTPVEKSPQRIGKLNIPEAFSGTGSTPLTPSTSPRRQGNLASQRIELAKSSESHPTPPSSPAGTRKWTVKTAAKTETPPKEEEKESGTTPPALKRLKQLQRKGQQSSISSSPVYKLPVLTSPSKAVQADSHAKTQANRTDSSSSTHSADTGAGNVARLLATFQ